MLAESGISHLSQVPLTSPTFSHSFGDEVGSSKSLMTSLLMGEGSQWRGLAEKPATIGAESRNEGVEEVPSTFQDMVVDSESAVGHFDASRPIDSIRDKGSSSGGGSGGYLDFVFR